MILHLLILASLAAPLVATAAMDSGKLRAELRDAIATGADYAGNVLLDASGQSPRDIGTAFGLRFLVAYYRAKFTE